MFRKFIFYIVLLVVGILYNSCNMTPKIYNPENFFEERKSFRIAEAIYQENSSHLKDYLKKTDTTTLNRLGKRGTTLLMYATILQKRNMMRILLEHGADPNVKSYIIPYASPIKENATRLCYLPLQEVCERYQYYNKKYIELLLQYSANINDTSCEEPPFISALLSTQNTIKLLDFLLKNGADINIKRSLDEETALISAAGTSQWEIVNWLLDQGADYKLTNNQNISVVHNIQNYIEKNIGTKDSKEAAQLLKERLQKKGAIFPKGPFFPIKDGEKLPDIIYKNSTQKNYSKQKHP